MHICLNFVNSTFKTQLVLVIELSFLDLSLPKLNEHLQLSNSISEIGYLENLEGTPVAEEAKETDCKNNNNKFEETTHLGITIQGVYVGLEELDRLVSEEMVFLALGEGDWILVRKIDGGGNDCPSLRSRDHVEELSHRNSFRLSLWNADVPPGYIVSKLLHVAHKLGSHVALVLGSIQRQDIVSCRRSLY